MPRDRGKSAVHRPQAERSKESQDRILAAAVESLVGEGYAGTSTSGIQARAGVSRGRLLHQFPSKDELLVAAAQHVSAQRLSMTEETAETLPSGVLDPQARLNAVIDVTWETYDRPYFWAATELWMAARTSPTLAAVILPAERRLGRAIRAALDTLYGAELRSHPLYPMFRDVIFTSMRGVAFTYAFDDRDPRTEPALRSWKRLGGAILLDSAG